MLEKKHHISTHSHTQLAKNVQPPPSHVRLINRKEQYQKHPRAEPTAGIVPWLSGDRKKHHNSTPSQLWPVGRKNMTITLANQPDHKRQPTQ
jgi:hypothetical protein